ncbi:MAG: hypothetical protein K0R50_426 [Eubacterium sp.]|nr:hypothetical protein [Eubacterium sp.]
MPEYLKMRCCMCPNIKFPPQTVCPGIKGTLHPADTQCRFVKAYIDNRGCTYKVMCPISANDTFKIVRRKPGEDYKEFRESILNTQYHMRFDDAQSALNKVAERRKWKEFKSGQERNGGE